jgi:hypothetical protein
VCVVVLHVGVAPAQSALARHATQLPVGTLQTPVAPAHWVLFVAEQAPHAPDGWQAGAPTPHSPSFVHARQVWVVPSQNGIPPAQSAEATQPTQVPVATWQIEVGPTHWLLLAAEHSAHAPDGWQAGVPPPHSPSPEHARHACVVRSQMGDAPPHCPDPRQPTQTPLTALHTGVVPAQVAAFVAEQAPQAPFG